jgi:DNA-binding FrmR family transcriptional regulator
MTGANVRATKANDVVEAGVEITGSDPPRRDSSAHAPDVVTGYTISVAECLTRLRRIEGQVRGIQHMIERSDGRIEVLTQIKSVTAALDSVALGVLDQHVRDCVARTSESGRDRVDEIIDDVAYAVARLRRT